MIDGADEKTVALIQAISDDAVKFTDKAVFVMKDGKGYDPVTGAEAAVPETAEDVVNNNEMRSELDAALASLKLFSQDDKVRADAVKTLRRASPTMPSCRSIEKAYAAERVPAIKEKLGDAARRHAAGQHRQGASASRRPRRSASAARPRPRRLLLDRQKVETDADVQRRDRRRRSARSRGGWPGASGSASIFTGISLGSILLLVALGLAITYGLMGVINMAHGELMMIGAYATYVVQNLFRSYLPGAFDAYVHRRDSGRLPRLGAGRRGARARRDPLPLRPPARDAARHLGHQPDAAAGGAHDLRRAERAGREPVVAVGRRRRR